MTSPRWIDDYGDDPVTRTTSTGTSAGTTTVSHVVSPPAPYAASWNPNPINPTTPLYRDDASNGPSSPQTVTIAPQVPAKVVSQQSGMAPFETLFKDLDFDATPIYNFWEKDEESSIHDRGNLPPDDLPRYIRLDWDAAPDLKDPAEFQKRRLMGYMPDAHDQYIELSPFGFGAHAVVGTLLEGIPFTPPHLQPSNFKQNAQQLANGHIFTGVVTSVVSAKIDNIIPPPIPSSKLVDEDEYLANHQETWGIPFNEINSALWKYNSSVYGLQQIMTPSVMSVATGLKLGNLFSGQFGVLPLLSSGKMVLTSQNPSSPSISFVSNISVMGTAVPGSRLRALSQTDADGSTINYQQTQDVVTNFIHTNFAGTMRPERVNTITSPHEAESVIALAPVADNLAVYSAAGAQHYSREISIPSFNAPATLKTLEYIGYVIEKYEQIDGSFQLVDTFYIPGREYTSYIDGKVKYGVSYRYRIRSVVRWSRPHGVGVLGVDPTVVNAPGSSIASLTPNDVSYFGSEWNKKWAYATLIDRTPPPPPDEFVVRPQSGGTEIDPRPFIAVSMKLPYNPQQDINKMVLFRKLQDQDGVDQTGWVQVQEFNAVERQGTRDLFVTQFNHQQDDVTGMKFDASQTERIESFVEFAPLNSLFIDHDVSFYGEGSMFRYVYAAQCLTRHGEESPLSDQLAARVNSDWKKKGEYPVDFVSCAGVDRNFDTGIFGTYPERRLRSEVISRPDVKSEVPAAVGLRGQTRVAGKLLSNANYIMRVESLDNGQSFDIPVTISVTNMPETINRLPVSPFVWTVKRSPPGRWR